LLDIQKLVEDENFEFEYTICRKGEDFNGDYGDYDLILMDYELANRSKGSDIIQEIRDDFYVDILFYSQHSVKTLKEQIFEKGLSGIFYCHRDDFIEEIKNIFAENMKRIQHPNNLRGLIMAETSDLDKLKKKILHKYFSLSHDKKEEFEEKIHKKIESHISDNIKKLNLYRTCKYELKKMDLEGNKEKEIQFLIDDPLFEFSKKGMAIVNLIEFLESRQIFNFKEYSEDIISKRNKLAHEPEIFDGENIMFGTLIFSLDECKRIRGDIRKYKSILESLYEEIIKLEDSN